MSKPLYFVDLDGVLADFLTSAEVLFDRPPGSLNGPGPFAIHKRLGLDFDEVDHRIRRASMYEHFWLHLPEFPWTKDLAAMFDFKDNAFILTSPWLNDHQCYSDKVAWCFHHLQIPSDHVLPVVHKYLLAGPNRYLIDDRGKNCADWVNHGGKIVRFPALHNGIFEEVNLQNPVDYVRREIRQWVPDFNFTARVP